jgi:hypothetical protein
MVVRKRLAPIAITVLLVAVAATVSFQWMSKDDTKRKLFYEQRAIPIGVAKAKSECLKTGYYANICNSLSGKASAASDATSETYWIVYVTSNDGKSYKASMIVKRTNNDLSNLTITNYLPDNHL